MFEQVKEIISKYTEAEITENSTLQADLGLSSFDVVSIVAEFEDAFGVEISDRDIREFLNVSSIISFLEVYIRKRNSSQKAYFKK